MPHLMRCPYCGLLQDEPLGAKQCSRCGGALEYESIALPGKETYLQVQMELDQVAAPAGQNVERYLLLTLRAPVKVPDAEAAPAGLQRLPLNFVAVLDVSGSMLGDKITQAKQAVRQALRHLHDGDVFSLVTFANQVRCPFPPQTVTQGFLDAVESALQEINAGGMTALCDGLETGIENAFRFKLDTNLVLLLSDGQANVGETDLEKIGQYAYQARQQDVLVSSLGVGLDYNEALMAEIATQGGGRFYHVQDACQIPAYLAGELGEVAALAARDVQIEFTVPAGATLIPLSAAYPVQQAGDQAVVSIGDIPCDTELEIPLRLAILAQAAGSRLSIQGRVTFRSPAGHALETPVNRVTVRFTPQAEYQLREGVVLPVAERVYAHMKASSVLGVARVMAVRPAQAEQQTATILTNLHTYAELLGEEWAEQEEISVRQQFVALHDQPSTAKRAVSDAHRFMRATKDFNH